RRKERRKAPDSSLRLSSFFAPLRENIFTYQYPSDGTAPYRNTSQHPPNSSSPARLKDPRARDHTPARSRAQRPSSRNVPQPPLPQRAPQTTFPLFDRSGSAPHHVAGAPARPRVIRTASPPRS